MRRLTFLAALILAAACTTAATSDPAALRDREWRLVSLTGHEGMPAGGATPTLRFDANGHTSAYGGCNSGGADYTVTGDKLTFAMFMTTKRACLDGAGNELETAYFSALESVRSYRINGSQLELLDSNGSVVARFEG